jgi:hypothetical protein
MRHSLYEIITRKVNIERHNHITLLIIVQTYKFELLIKLVSNIFYDLLFSYIYIDGIETPKNLAYQYIYSKEILLTI